MQFMLLEFPNHATCSATHTMLKMVSQAEQAKSVLWIHEAKSVIMVQRRS
jgi:hypothetical protein